MSILQRLGILLVLAGAGAILYEIFGPDVSLDGQFRQNLLRYAIGALLLGAVLIKFLGKRTPNQESDELILDEGMEDK